MPAFFSKHLTYQYPFTIQKSLATGRMSTRDLRAGQVSDFAQEVINMRAFAAFLLVIVLFGCAKIPAATIQVGKTTKEELIQIWGQPSATGVSVSGKVHVESLTWSFYPNLIRPEVRIISPDGSAYTKSPMAVSVRISGGVITAVGLGGLRDGSN